MVEFERINLYFISVFPPPYRGVGVWNERILKELEKQAEIDLTVYSTRQKCFLKKSAEVQAIPLFKRGLCIIYTYLRLLIDLFKGRVGFKEYLSAGRFITDLWSILSQLDAQKNYCLYISHANLFTLTMVYVLGFLKPSSKVILHEHGSGAIEYAAQRPKVVQRIFNKVDRVIVASNYMKGICIVDGCNPLKINVLPCGINFVERPYLEKKNIVLFCGSLENHKDPLTYIKAIPKVLEHFKAEDLLFAIIGEGSLRGEIEKEVEKLGITKYVKLYGALANDEVLRYYQKTKIFVLPSIREPFGIVIIEAMSCYTPCIVTQVGGMPEIVDATFGRVINEKSPEQLSQAIIEILEKDSLQYKEMSLLAFKAAKAYDMKKIGQDFCKIVNRVAMN